MTTAIAAKRIIPAHLMRDRYWAPLLTIFLEQPKLLQHSHYVDLEEGTVDVKALMRASKPWADSEKFMLHLALNLFNENNCRKELNLGDMDYLDSHNKELAFKAIRLRFA